MQQQVRQKVVDKDAASPVLREEVSPDICGELLKGDRGLAFIELLIAAPFLLVLTIGIIDIGRALNQYMLLNYAVNSGIRLGMSIPNLAEGKFDEGSPTQSCAPASGVLPATVETGHQVIQKRVHELVEEQSEVLKSAYCITSELHLVEDGDIPERSITIRIDASYDAIFPLFNGLPISVEATGPYLLAAN